MYHGITYGRYDHRCQKRIEEGVKKLLDTYIEEGEFTEKYVIVSEGTISESYTVE